MPIKYRSPSLIYQTSATRIALIVRALLDAYDRRMLSRHRWITEFIG